MGYGTGEQISVKKSNEYNIPLHLIFMEYRRAFDLIELWAIYTLMGDARIGRKYKNIITQIITIQIKLVDEIAIE